MTPPLVTVGRGLACPHTSFPLFPTQILRDGGDASSAQSFSVSASYSKGFSLSLPVPIEFVVMVVLGVVFYNVQKRL